MNNISYMYKNDVDEIGNLKGEYMFMKLMNNFFFAM
jgi:hypothetical protein